MRVPFLLFFVITLILVVLLVGEIESAGYRRGYHDAYTGYATAMHCIKVTEDHCVELGMKNIERSGLWSVVFQELLDSWFRIYRNDPKTDWGDEK